MPLSDPIIKALYIKGTGVDSTRLNPYNSKSLAHSQLELEEKMDWAMFASVILGIAGILILVLLALMSTPQKSKHQRRLIFVVGAVTAVLLAIPGSSFLWFQYATFGTTVVTFDKTGEMQIHPRGTFCWEWNPDCISVPTSALTVTADVTVVTANPKIRKIFFDVNTTITDIKTFYRTPERRQMDNDWSPHYSIHGTPKVEDVGGEAARLTTYQLNEFLNTNSVELSQFYNWLDEGQNARMGALVEGWLNPRLAEEGLAVKFQKFWIE